MPHFLRPFMLLALLACALVTPLVGADAAPPAGAQAGKLRVLIIGNSFSGNAMRYFPGIAKAAGSGVEVKHLAVGGSSLETHWTMAEAALKDANDPKGRYGEGGHDGTLPEALAKGPWDVVTIQQHSQKSSDQATFHPFIDQMVALIRKHAPTARLMIHDTWAYRSDDVQFGTGPQSTMASSEVMYQRISAAYATMAKQFALEVIPSGEAFHLVESDPAHRFVADPAWNRKTAVFPALPVERNSLNVGWAWSGKDGKNLLAYDPKHANPRGEYLAGCVWYESLFHRTVVGNGFQPKELTAEEVAYFQQIAHTAVERGLPGLQPGK